eukprot:TRINITY_DN1572_c0_g1_i1.p1 TRINITY_DN1572_c0_g1~~TRINITY_DN1572_c0_g1_i1.p1  ORF type:complete len:745 (+),score=113.23 TRINITY_DN1572_c0_g1_i1:316-2550(+)
MSIGMIPRCDSAVSPCNSLLYVKSPLADAVVHQLAGQNHPPLAVCPLLFNSSCDIATIESELVSTFAVAHPNATFAILILGNQSLGAMHVVGYTLMYNATADVDYTPAFLRAIDQAIVSVLGGKAVNIVVDTKPFPIIRPRDFTSGVISSSGALFLVCPVMFNLILFAYQLVVERERSLVAGLRANGMKQSMYWLSWLLLHLMIVVVNMLVTFAVGAAVGLDVFRQVASEVILVIFGVFGLVSIPLSYLLATLTSTAKTSAVVGFLLFVIAAFLQIIFGGAQIYVFYGSDSAPVIPAVLSFFPPFAFAKCFSDVTMTVQNGKWYSWQSLFAPVQIHTAYSDFTVTPTIESLHYMIYSGVVFAVLAWYVDAVVLVGRHPLFMFTRQFYGCSVQANLVNERTPLLHGSDHEALTYHGENFVAASNASSLRIVGLSKIHKPTMSCLGKPLIALSDLYLHVPQGSLVALLGHNGAGKTTTVNCLTGTTKPTSGTAFVCGHDVVTDLDAARRNIGVCPQHDLLWSELTLIEHLSLFCALRGLTGDAEKAQILTKLKQVDLFPIRTKRANQCSGGQRRRLSVVLCTVGDPMVLFLDEPTAGMDPQSRRDVWQLIHDLKSQHIVLLTTHTMSEAESLADTIGVLVHGTLKCVGTPLDLKQRYGSGHSFTITVNNLQMVGVARKLVFEHIPGAVEMPSRAEAILIFRITMADMPRLRLLLVELEGRSVTLGEFSLSDCSLEEVFLNVTNELH